MKKVVALLTISGALFAMGCTDTKEAIEEYCKWEKDCNIRTYDDCMKTFNDYLKKAPDCEGELNDMYWDVEGFECKAYKGWVSGIDVCADPFYYDYLTTESCDKDVIKVKNAYDHLKVCLEAEGVKYEMHP